MENGTSLDEIFGDESGQAEAPPPETIGQPRDEHGRFAPKDTGDTETEQEAPQQEAPPASEQEPSHIPVAALKDERAKRQQYEDQLRQATERLQQYEAYFAQQQGGTEQEQEPDPVEFIAQQVMQRLTPQTEAQMLTMRVNVAEEFARQKWADYDEKVEHFKEAAKTNPFLLQELRTAANPAEYAYNAANKILEAKQYGTASPSREQLEAEIRQKIMAEIGMPPKVQAPTTLANERSTGSRSGPAWSGPTPLGDIFGR
jgi:hypothetical protein